MTDEMLMDQLSKGYIAFVASRHGYKYAAPDPDTGVDLKVCPTVARREPGGRTRWLDSDKQLDIQLKGVHRRRVQIRDDVLAYDLEVKAFNDLVYRQTSLTPLYLVLLVLPDDQDNWLGVGPEELAVRQCAYWWLPEAGTQPTENEATKRIEIPLAQRVTIDFFPERFRAFYGAER